METTGHELDFTPKKLLDDVAFSVVSGGKADKIYFEKFFIFSNKSIIKIAYILGVKWQCIFFSVYKTKIKRTSLLFEQIAGYCKFLLKCN